jgi:acetyl-CoA carboxylase biotin carboxylase subunit
MRRALGEYEIFGIKTNVPFFRRLLEHREFVAGRLDTGFIDRVLAAGLMEEAPPSPEEEHVAMLAAALHVGGREGKKTPAATHDSTWKNAGRDSLLNQWPRRGGWRS